MTGWDREYLANKDEYLELFDRVMQKEQETNVEFLEKNLAEITNRKYAVTCNSGTDALAYSLMSMGIRPGDEVITSNLSWISTASCISMVGATPVFCDIDLDNYHLSYNSVKRMISNKTKAIVYPHLFGNMSDMEKIKQLGIPIVEDACQSLGSSYNGVVAGSIGDISTLSFNANKVVAGISCGGAILTDEKDRAEFFKKIRKHGNNEFLGFNSKMLLFNAEVINFRLKRMNEWQAKRQEIAKIYDNALKDTANVVQYTSKEENLHAAGGIAILNKIREEYPEVVDYTMELKIYEEAKEAYDAELRLIEWILDGYENDFLSYDILKTYLGIRMNDSLEKIGFEKLFDVDEDLAEKTLWMEEEIYVPALTDFFHKKPIDYQKAMKSFDAGELF